MFLPQWLLKALRRVFCSYGGGLSPLKAILLLWRSFWRFFRCFSRTQDDGAPDEPLQHIPDQVSYLPQAIELTTHTISLVVEDEPVPAVVCRATLPNDPRFSHDMVPISVARPSQTSLAVESDLNPLNEQPPLHGSCPSSITQPPNEGYLNLHVRSNPSRLSQDTNSTVFNSAADTRLNPSHAHLPHARPTSGEGEQSFDSEAETSAVVMPLPPAAQSDGQNQDLSTLQKAYPFFVPICPWILPRAGSRPRNPHIPNVPSIDPLTTTFTLHGVPSDWSLHINPQGVRYYVHEMMFHASVTASLTSCSSRLRIFTYEDIILPEVLRELTEFLDNILSYMHAKAIILPSKVDLVLSLGWKLEDGTRCCGYYFADHMHRSIFWLDSFDASILANVKLGNTSQPSHLAHAIEAEYWLHYCLFPCQEMTSDIIEEVNDFLIDCIAETTFGFSTARHGFTIAELQQYFSIVNIIRSNPRSYSHPGSVCSIALIMEKRSRDRYVNLYGEPQPFLCTNNSGEHGHVIYKRSRTGLIALLSPLLFFAPDIHCAALHEVCHDGISKTDWSALIRKLSTEWQDFVINATVLLNANIAFLAIQSIDESSDDKGRSPTQIASYVSTIMSIGSVTMGLLLLQKNRHKSRVYFLNKWEFLGIQRGDLGERLGLETLAIMYSLPWALLMWAMIFFLAAFCLMCFTASSLSVRMIVGSALLAIGILIFWYLTISCERYELRWYVRAHVHLVNAWNRLPRGLSVRIPVKFNMGWTQRTLRMGSNDVEMAPTGSHKTA